MQVRVPFVGASQQTRSLNVNAERTVNCYVEASQDNTRQLPNWVGMAQMVEWI